MGWGELGWAGDVAHTSTGVVQVAKVAKNQPKVHRIQKPILMSGPDARVQWAGKGLENVESKFFHIGAKEGGVTFQPAKEI